MLTRLLLFAIRLLMIAIALTIIALEGLLLLDGDEAGLLAEARRKTILFLALLRFLFVL